MGTCDVYMLPKVYICACCREQKEPRPSDVHLDGGTLCFACYSDGLVWAARQGLKARDNKDTVG